MQQNLILKQLSDTFTEIPFNKMLGLKLDQLGPDFVTMNFHMKEEFIGNFLHGILHGGVISSVLDMAAGMAVMSAAIHKNTNRSVDELMGLLSKTSTVDLQVSFINPGKGELFIAKAWLTKSGKKLSFARMELSNQEGTLIATGSATYLLR